MGAAVASHHQPFAHGTPAHCVWAALVLRHQCGHASGIKLDYELAAHGQQRERLQERLDDPAKHWKFSMSDIEARKQWSEYQKAYEMLLAATHTPWAPWTIVPANSKTHRNLMIATLVREVLKGLQLRYPTGDSALEHFTVE